jgi:hypothetical protein
MIMVEMAQMDVDPHYFIHQFIWSDSLLFNWMTPKEFLQFEGDLSHVRKKQLTIGIDETLAFVSLMEQRAILDLIQEGLVKQDLMIF